MVAEKWKKKLLVEIFGIFECILTQNPSNQDSQLSWLFQTIWNSVRKSKNMGSRELFMQKNDFKICSSANSANGWKTEFYSF